MSCKHTGWLRLCRRGSAVKLQVTDRPERILDDLSEPDRESGGLVLFVGNKQKATALEHLGIHDSREGGRRGIGEVHLFSQRKSRCTSAPWVVADIDIPAHSRLPTLDHHSICHETTEHVVSMQDDEKMPPSQLADHIYHVVLFPFVDVVCLFIEDVGSVKKMIRRLSSWVDKGRPSTAQLLPHLILVIDRELEPSEQADVDEFLRPGQKLNPYTLFQKIRLVNLSTWMSLRRGRHYSFRRWDRFRSELAASIKLTRCNRSSQMLNFSAGHLAKLMHHAACRPAVQPPPFNFVKAARSHISISPDIRFHLKDFLQRIHSLDKLMGFGIPMLTSSLVLDQYPPHMHAFSPHLVFDTTYVEHCREVCREAVLSQPGSCHLMLPSSFTALVEKGLTAHFEQYIHSGKSVATYHREQLIHHSDEWSNFHSDDTCFSCLVRRPMYKFPCLHLMCQTCLRIFGQQDDEGTWNLQSCLLCGEDTGGFFTKLKPDTAAVRVLSLDGGGAKAVIPLTFLQEIQAHLGLPYLVQNHFDVIYGTSSGAISVCGLCVNGWSVEDCIASSISLARMIFKPRQVAQLPFAWIPIMRDFWRILLSVAFDSRYPADGLERALQKLFGSQRGILDQSKATEMGQFIGMPVTTTQDVSTYVITNYNGVGERQDDSEYQILRPNKGYSSIPLWKFIRGTTAAPSFFTVQNIEGFGDIQDGGVKDYNNPDEIAMKEAAAIFKDTEVGLVVSLATGSATVKSSTSTAAQSSEGELTEAGWTRTAGQWLKGYKNQVFDNSFVARLLRVMMKQNSVQQLAGNHVIGEQGEYFRFDMQFDGSSPSLDDVTKLEQLGQKARETIRTSPELLRLVSYMKAQLFYFELDCMPRWGNGALEFSARICCRWSRTSPEFHALMSQLDQATVRMRSADRHFKSSSVMRLQDVLASELEFTASRHVPFEITLGQKSTGYFHISSSPFTVDSLIRAQKLDAHFGTSDHRRMKTRNSRRVKKARQRYLRTSNVES